jgi:hypothetical protein
MVNRRKRSQVGQRISPWPVQSSRLQLNVTCPFCFRRSWWHRLFDLTPDGMGGYTQASDRWAPVPIALRAMRRWPRKPDGGRGFCWESVPERDFDREHGQLVGKIHYRFALRAIAWLEHMGVDISATFNSGGLSRLRTRAEHGAIGSIIE